MRQPIADRLWSKTRVGGPHECWMWHAALDTQGYGVIWLDGKMALAHRVAYALVVGPVPAGAHLLHSCDNRLCVNPAHCRPGTQKENISDMHARGRAFVPRGEKNGLAKLTQEQVLEIRETWRAGTSTQTQIAARYGVTQQAISKVVTGARWRAGEESMKYLELTVSLAALDPQGRQFGRLRSVRAPTRELLEQRLAKALDEFEEHARDVATRTPPRVFRIKKRAHV